MGKSTPSYTPQPQAPDPAATAKAQSASNVNTAVANSYLNNINQNTPYGSLHYDVTGHQTVDGNDVPTWTANQTLTPAGQKLQDTNMDTTQGTADLANQYVKRIADATSQPFNYDSLGAAPTYNSDSAAKAAQTLMDRNQPQMDRDRAALEQRLADQGVGLQDPAYRSAMDQYQRGVNDFRLGAQSQGQQFASNDYSSAENSYQNQIAQMTNLRSQPINEVSALLGTGTGVQSPTFVNTPQQQVAPTDVAGIYGNSYATQMQAYMQGQQMQNQQNAATMGGLFGLGSAALTGGVYGYLNSKPKYSGGGTAP